MRTVTAGSVFYLVATAEDSKNELTPFYAGTLDWTSSDGAATLPADAGLTSGRSTVAATLNTVGTQTVTCTDIANGSIVGSVTVEVVSSGSFADFGTDSLAWGFDPLVWGI